MNFNKFLNLSSLSILVFTTLMLTDLVSTTYAILVAVSLIIFYKTSTNSCFLASIAEELFGSLKNKESREKLENDIKSKLKDETDNLNKELEEFKSKSSKLGFNIMEDLEETYEETKNMVGEKSKQLEKDLDKAKKIATKKSKEIIEDIEDTYENIENNIKETYDKIVNDEKLVSTKTGKVNHHTVDGKVTLCNKKILKTWVDGKPSNKICKTCLKNIK